MRPWTQHRKTELTIHSVKSSTLKQRSRRVGAWPKISWHCVYVVDLPANAFICHTCLLVNLHCSRASVCRYTRLLQITNHLEQLFYKTNHLFFHFANMTTLNHEPSGEHSEGARANTIFSIAPCKGEQYVIVQWCLPLPWANTVWSKCGMSVSLSLGVASDQPLWASGCEVLAVLLLPSL